MEVIMKKAMILSMGLVLALTLTMASLAMARSGMQQFGPGERGQLRSQDCPVFSSLTEEQQQELLQTTLEHREWMYPKKQQMIARQAELNALLATEGTDSSEIEKTRKELAELNREIFERKLDHKIKLSQDYNIKTRMLGQARGGKRSFESGRAFRQDCPRALR
jgi:Spy/CpxP family protein refolding chaperone